MLFFASTVTIEYMLQFISIFLIIHFTIEAMCNAFNFLMIITHSIYLDK